MHHSHRKPNFVTAIPQPRPWLSRLRDIKFMFLFCVLQNRSFVTITIHTKNNMRKPQKACSLYYTLCKKITVLYSVFNKNRKARIKTPKLHYKCAFRSLYLLDFGFLCYMLYKRDFSTPDYI